MAPKVRFEVRYTMRWPLAFRVSRLLSFEWTYMPTFFTVLGSTRSIGYPLILAGCRALFSAHWYTSHSLQLSWSSVVFWVCSSNRSNDIQTYLHSPASNALNAVTTIQCAMETLGNMMFCTGFLAPSALNLEPSSRSGGASERTPSVYLREICYKPLKTVLHRWSWVGSASE